MDFRFHPADYERERHSREAKKVGNYYALNANGFNNDEARDVVPPKATKTAATKGTKRKEENDGEPPASKRARQSKPAVKPTSKGKAAANTPVSKSPKKAVLPRKGKQAQTQASPGRKTAEDSKKASKAAPKDSKPNALKKDANSATRGGRGKKTGGASNEQQVSETVPMPEQNHEEAERNEETTCEENSQAQAGAPAATPRENRSESLPAANTLDSTETRAQITRSRQQAKLDASISTLHPSAPHRQFFAATAFSEEFVDKMDDLFADTSSELSDVPDDLDMTTPIPNDNTVSHAEGNSAKARVEASDAQNMPTAGEIPLSHPQSCARRNTKQIQRFSDFVQPATAIEDDDAGAFSSVTVVSDDSEVSPQDSSVENELEVSPPVSKTTKKISGRIRGSKTPIKPKASAKTTGRKGKQSSTDENTEPAKRRKSLVVTLAVSSGLDQFNGDTPENDTSNLVTPRAPKKPSKRQQNGLLTPPDSSPRRDDQEHGLPSFDPQKAELVELAQRLMARVPVDKKPLPQGQPEVWADSRQALCETVPYFKMPHSGCHSNDRHVYAFLFDGSGHCREYTDPDVIISRAGGSMELDKNAGLLQKANHAMGDSQVQSVINDIALQNPCIMIAGSKHEGAVCQLPHRYNVLGWYKPITVWGEKTQGRSKIFNTIKYRFEQLDESKKAWFAPAEPVVSDEDREIAGPLLRKTCSHCQTEYPQVYLLGWMCLNPECDQFWHHNGRDAPYGALLYNPAFLLHRTQWAVEEEPYSVKPPVPNVGNFVGDNLTQINTRGICCPDCGRCSSRRLFKGWKCDNPQCSFQNFPNHIPIKVPMLHTPMDNSGDGPALGRNKHSEGVKVEISYLHGFKAYKYTVPGVNGSFMHLVANARINREKGGPDDMFHAIQDQNDPAMDLHLERRRFGIEKNGGTKADLKKTASGRKSTAGESMVSDTAPLDSSQIDESVLPADQNAESIQDGDFMTAFSMNYGMPYNFVASGSSMPFAEAPWPVRAVRADLNWASQTFLDSENHVEFNEELIFAYLEGQKIEYHDDGEEGLGPRIATMSLGGKAKMFLRMKGKHYSGCSKTGSLTPERPIPGGIQGKEMDEKRLAAWEELEQLKQTDKKLYDKRRKDLARELGLYTTRGKASPDLVTVTLNHGDIILMEGHEIQQYLEHKVVPEQCLRFALTCRVVLLEHLKAEEKPHYDVEPDDETMSSLRRLAEREKLAKEEQQKGG